MLHKMHNTNNSNPFIDLVHSCIRMDSCEFLGIQTSLKIQNLEIIIRMNIKTYINHENYNITIQTS